MTAQLRIGQQATPAPAPYVRQTSFTDWEANHPGVPAPGADLDGEFNAIRISITDTQARLAQIQNDSGTLANESVGKDQLTAALLDAISGGFYPRGDWLANTGYAVSDAVNSDGILWVAVVAHTSSGNFTADVGAGYWMFINQPVAASAIPVAPIANIPSTSVQGVLQVLVAQIVALTARVVALENAQ